MLNQDPSSHTPPSTSLNLFSLPTELFVLVAAQLEHDDLIAATQVCQSWRNTLVDAVLLWNKSLSIDLTKDHAVDRARELVSRAKGGLAALRFTVPNEIEEAEDSLEDDTFTNIVSDLSIALS